MKLIFAVLISFLLLFCNENPDPNALSKFLEKGNVIAFIQANKEGCYISDTQGNYGDIILFSLSDSTTFRLTNNRDYENGLTLSSDKKYLLFASSRSENRRNNEPIMDALFNYLYTVNLTNGEYKEFGTDVVGLSSIEIFMGLQWSNNGIYFSNFDEYSLMIDNHKELKALIVLDSLWHITEQTVSSDNKYIAFSCGMFEQPPYDIRVGFFDIEKNQITWIAKGAMWKDAGTVCSWDLTGERFLYANEKLYFYDVKQNERSEIFIPGNGEEIIVSNCRYLNDNEIIFIYRNYKEDPLDELGKNKIGIYNFNTKVITDLPISDNYKDYLVVFDN